MCATVFGVKWKFWQIAFGLVAGHSFSEVCPEACVLHVVLDMAKPDGIGYYHRGTPKISITNRLSSQLFIFLAIHLSYSYTL